MASRLIARLGRRSPVAVEFHRRCHRPAAAVAVLIGVQLSLTGATLPAGDRQLLNHAASLALIAAVAWLIVKITFVGEDLVLRRYDVGAADNLLARKKRTQVVVLNRVTVVVISIIAIAAMLMTFSQVRALGASLLASAGIVGIIAGTASRPLLGNLVAGIQLAFTEPVRLDDVVVVEGEWGRIEELTLTYVVVRLWDLRRRIVPISQFVEKSFENWTRSTSQIVGAALFHLDYRVPVDEVRTEFERILDTSPLWDRQIGKLQVTDTSDRTVEVRASMSASDSPSAFDLRCEVRERLLAWLQVHHPDALPRSRIELSDNGAEDRRDRRPDPSDLQLPARARA
jgi:small-conductance mechanosensitive channel